MPPAESPHARNAAEFDPTNTYRYSLTRFIGGDGPPLLWVGMNPSSATAREESASVIRMNRFSARERACWYAGVAVFALFAAHPDSLFKHPDPVGPDNDATIEKMAAGVHRQGGRIIAAWGAVPDQLQERVKAVVGILSPYPLWCLGTTKYGHPRHPLFLARDTPLVRYEPPV